MSNSNGWLWCALLAGVWFSVAAGAGVKPVVDPVESVAADDERGFLVNGSDDCADAWEIHGFGVYPFNLAGATTDGQAHPSCLNAESSQVWRDRWYRWTCSVSGEVEVSTCQESALDTRIVVYAPSSPCIPANEYVIGCNDDACGTQSRVTFLAQAGQSYLIRIGRYGVTEPAAMGSGNIAISTTAPLGVCEGGPLGQDLQPLALGNASTGFFRVADDVVANVTGSIDGMCWWGSYDLFPGGADDFRVTYWSDMNGLPGIPIASFDQERGLGVLRASTGLAALSGAPIFEYSAHHEPVPVAKGQRVWVEIRNRIGSSDDYWFWQGSTGGAALNDLSHLSNWGNATVIPNRAFCPHLVTSCTNDTNGDGLVNFADLNSVISQFNAACP